MAGVIWTPRALEDLESIRAYISHGSAEQATRFVSAAFRAARRLRTHPQSGRVAPEIGSGQARELLLGDYRMIYGLFQGDAWIVAIVHGARDIGRALQE